MELNRHPSTIYRELKRIRHLDEHPQFRGYFPTVAQDKAMGRRVRGAKVARNPQLARYIADRLAAAWSPEQIAGYVRRHRLAGLSIRSEEHTSELQSLMRISYAVFCLKKTKNPQQMYTYKYQYHNRTMLHT